MSRDARETIIFDFAVGGDAADWRVINDTVMGGRSESSVDVEDGVLVFSGELSVANQGGFCSTRSGTFSRDLSDLEGLVVRIRTGDRSFSLTARDAVGTDTVGYHHPLPVTGDEWETVHALFADFEATYHGRVLEDASALNTERVRSVGFIIAGGQEGAFRLEVASIAAFRSG